MGKKIMVSVPAEAPSLLLALTDEELAACAGGLDINEGAYSPA